MAPKTYDPFQSKDLAGTVTLRRTLLCRSHAKQGIRRLLPISTNTTGRLNDLPGNSSPGRLSLWSKSIASELPAANDELSRIRLAIRRELTELTSACAILRCLPLLTRSENLFTSIFECANIGAPWRRVNGIRSVTPLTHAVDLPAR